MSKSLKIWLLTLPVIFSFSVTEVSSQETDEIEETEEIEEVSPDSELITDRDRGARERPDLYYYNRQNVKYNRRYESDQPYNQPSQSNYYNNGSSDSFDTFNRSYYDNNTSPNLYLNR